MVEAFGGGPIGLPPEADHQIGVEGDHRLEVGTQPCAHRGEVGDGRPPVEVGPPHQALFGAEGHDGGRDRGDE